MLTALQQEHWLSKKVYTVEVSFIKNNITVYEIVFTDGSKIEAFMDSGKVFIWSRKFSSNDKIAQHVNLSELEYIWDYILCLHSKMNDTRALNA